VWLNALHLRPFYMWSDISRDEIVRKFVPRLNAAHLVRCRIAMIAGVPYGFAQWYPTASYPDSGAMIAGFTRGVSVDYFIGDAAFLGRHLAAPMLRAVVADVASCMTPQDRDVFIAHDVRNEIAARATLAAGFAVVRACVDKNGQPGVVYSRSAG
jgi:hypothetical protein